MLKIAQQRYEDFDAQRRATEASAADADDLRVVEDMERELKHKPTQNGEKRP